MADKKVRTFIPTIEPELDSLIAENDLRLGLYQIAYQKENLTERLKKALLTGRFEIKGGRQYEQPELAQLDKDTELILRAGGVDEIVSVDFAIRKIRQIIDRQSKERFTFDEIAIILAQESCDRVSYIREQQEKAFYEGRLIFLRDGSPVDPSTFDDPMGVYGFDSEYSTPDKINSWLKSWGAEYRFPSKSEVPHEKPKPKGLMQEDAIINWLRSNNYDPVALPKNTPGKSGIKANCRDCLLANRYELFTKSTFADAWKRLRKENRIIDSST